MVSQMSFVTWAHKIMMVLFSLGSLPASKVDVKDGKAHSDPNISLK